MAQDGVVAPVEVIQSSLNERRISCWPSTPSPTSKLGLPSRAAGTHASCVRLKEARAQQDNEAFHLLILEEFLATRGTGKASCGAGCSRG